MFNYTLILTTLLILFGCTDSKKYDLGITNANVLDVITGKINKNQTILILNGRIEDVINSSKKFNCNEIINANGRLITPGFIDTHIHPTDVFGDYDNAPKFLIDDSSTNLRKKLSNEYLPFGTTTVLTMG